MNSGRMREDLGQEVLVVPSGAPALGVTECDGAFDLMLTDQTIPQLSAGARPIAAARAPDPGLRVVFATYDAELASSSRQRRHPAARQAFFSTDLGRIGSSERRQRLTPRSGAVNMAA